MFNGKPDNPENICQVFREKPDWYDAARASSDHWDIPIPVMMAIMHGESGFRANAKPPRRTCLFILPGPRMSSAYGYCQAIDSTWEMYMRASGNYGADRDDFDDAIDFIGWYCDLSRSKCGISGDDAYHHYLAYHEGQTGFLRYNWENKPRLMDRARRVDQQARRYDRQLISCEHEFETGRGCFLWPF